jgi:hypothetical protein
MTLDDIDVRAALHRATDHLTTAPSLLDDVRQGGRRKVLRRRVFLGAGLAIAATASVGGVLRFSESGDVLNLSSPLLDQPTRGDLAGDEAYLRQVRDAWRRKVKGGRGEPHVMWAGRTPAGPAAYVAQATATNPVVVEPEGFRLVADAGFVEPTATGPQVMQITNVDESGLDGIPQAVLLGTDRDVLLVLDFGDPVEFSPELRYTADGRIDRKFQRVVFIDGAAVLRVPPQRTKITFALSRPPVRQANQVSIANDLPFQETPQSRMDTHMLPGAERVWGNDPQETMKQYLRWDGDLGAYVDSVGTHRQGASPQLYLYGATPDGRRLFVMTMQYDDDPTRVIALLARGDSPLRPVVSGFVHWQADPPVRLVLPDGQGIVVAAEGKQISYRVNGVDQIAGRDAALLPADATDITAG